MENEPKVALSASRIKTLESCSWLYWCQYHLKLPKSTNEGAQRGTACHNIFEILLNKRHIKHFKLITKAKDITASKPIHRLVVKYMKQLEIPTTSFQLVSEMIVTGLLADFFVKGYELLAPEYRFEIKNKNPRYYLKGFMDCVATKGEKLQISDYKSSKEKFKNEGIVSNIQAICYSLAAKKIWPKLQPFVRFVFLRFPEDPLQEVNFTDDTLKGAEEYFAYVQQRVDEFSEKDAKSDYAWDKPDPKGGEFGGQLLCGKYCKYKGELKKDGSPKWHCGYRFDFNYYSIKKDGVVQYSMFEKDKDKIKLKDGETLEKSYYGGCERFKSNNALNDFNVSTKVKFDPLENF